MFSITSLTSRFIYPFFYTNDATALSALKCGEKTVWHSEEPEEFYRQEMLKSLTACGR